MTSQRNRVAARIAARRLRGCEHHDKTCSRCLADAVLPLLADAYDKGAAMACEVGDAAFERNPYHLGGAA